MTMSTTTCVTGTNISKHDSGRPKPANPIAATSRYALEPQLAVAPIAVAVALLHECNAGSVRGDNQRNRDQHPLNYPLLESGVA